MFKGILLDLIVIAIITAFTLISARRGFVRVVIELVGFVVAVTVAFALSAPLADVIYDKMIEPSVISSAEEVSAGTADQITTAAWDSLPDWVKDNADSLNISADSFRDKVGETVQNGAGTAAATASQDIIKPVVTNLLGTLFTIILLIILLFVVKILAKLVNKLFSFSVIGKLNRTLGGIVGVLKGVIITLLFCMIVTLIVSLTKDGFLIFTKAAIDRSVLFKFFASFSPFL